MIKQTLILGLLPISVAASATCVNDPPEIGDIGPASELVCSELSQRFLDAALAVEGRSIHSSTDVSVIASVDGKPVSMRDELSGYSWRLADSDNCIGGTANPTAGLWTRVNDLRPAAPRVAPGTEGKCSLGRALGRPVSARRFGSVQSGVGLLEEQECAS